MPEAAALQLGVGASSDAKMILNAAVNSVYNITQDADRTRKTLSMQANDQVAREFDKLRKHYPIRREFSTFTVTGVECIEDKKLLSGLGFQVS